jgi:uncharacterized membrane protein
MRHGIKLLLIGTACGLLAGCGDSVESLTASDPLPVDAAGRIEFSQVAPILREKCAICHGEYTDSAKIVKNAGQIANTIEGYYMPAPGVAQLAPQDRATLLAWLRQQPARSR